MGTKNNPGDFDCYQNAEPDEPMFVLLGRDLHAPVMTLLWALARYRAGESEAKVTEAIQCAKSMNDWALSIGKRPFDSGQPFDECEELLITATTGMREHPEGYDFACNCNLCRSYA